MQNRKRDTDVQKDFGTLWEKARVGCSERIALKQIYYQGWNRSPAQVGCMRQVLKAGALGRPRGMGWGGRWEGGSGWGTHANPWVIHVNVWQKPLQYCKVISLQLIKVKKKRVEVNNKAIKPSSNYWRQTSHHRLNSQRSYKIDVFMRFNYILFSILYIEGLI